jgi:hypothetical protein
MTSKWLSGWWARGKKVPGRFRHHRKRGGDRAKAAGLLEVEEMPGGGEESSHRREKATERMEGELTKG